MASLSEAQRLALRTFVQQIVGPTPNLELDGRFIPHIIDYNWEPQYVWFSPCGGAIVTIMLLFEAGNMHDGRYAALVCPHHLPINHCHILRHLIHIFSVTVTRVHIATSLHQHSRLKPVQGSFHTVHCWRGDKSHCWDDRRGSENGSYMRTLHLHRNGEGWHRRRSRMKVLCIMSRKQSTLTPNLAVMNRRAHGNISRLCKACKWILCSM